MNKLKEIRLKLRLSQEELGSYLNCTQSHLSRIESGEYQLNLYQYHELKKLCDAHKIKCDTSYFV